MCILIWLKKDPYFQIGVLLEGKVFFICRSRDNDFTTISITYLINRLNGLKQARSTRLGKKDGGGPSTFFYAANIYYKFMY